MKQLLKKLQPADIVFLLLAAVACIYAIFIPPAHGVADQGDFERVMGQAGLGFFHGHSFYDFVQTKYTLKWMNPLFLIGLLPATSYIYPIAVAKLLCRICFLGYFDTRVLAAVFSLYYSIVCFLIFRQIPVKNQIGKSVLAAIFIAVFFDGVNLTMFNSMYGQSMLLIALASFLLSGVLILRNLDNLKKRHIVFFFAACVLLLGAKLQCISLLPFLILAFVFLIRKCSYKKLSVVLLCILLWYSVGNYVIWGGQLNRDTQYNSVFYGILKDSRTPEEDLEAMGLDPDLAKDAGKHAYLDPGEYAYPPRTEIMEEKFYSKMDNVKLAKFYLTHPARIIRAMEVTAGNAFHTSIELGTFSKDAGFEPGAYEYRFDGWSTVRDRLPKTLWFIVPVYILFFAVGLYELIRRKNLYAGFYLLILCLGLIQFPMPYIGNGNADIVKQLYLFNITFDVGLFVAIGYVVAMIKKKVVKK